MRVTGSTSEPIPPTYRNVRLTMNSPTHHQQSGPLTDDQRQRWCAIYAGMITALCFKLRDTAGLVPQQSVITEIEETAQLVAELGGVVFDRDAQSPNAFLKWISEFPEEF